MQWENDCFGKELPQSMKILDNHFYPAENDPSTSIWEISPRSRGVPVFLNGGYCQQTQWCTSLTESAGSDAWGLLIQETFCCLVLLTVCVVSVLIFCVYFERDSCKRNF
ncbi:hypothetical protein TNIN_281071 [Trichonephila inaurata madagascariensis]|uniref:Uncharacterized protein n=1 Tax=Trichonephila inaurata madagascariensis TaxID=2747483 RepID=A0A8X6XMG9_9ARAC|nr:hypothetical protein TNIN_281071 [Trichonephila inaurata madagascariensis]